MFRSGISRILRPLNSFSSSPSVFSSFARALATKSSSTTPPPPLDVYLDPADFPVKEVLTIIEKTQLKDYEAAKAAQEDPEVTAIAAGIKRRLEMTFGEIPVERFPFVLSRLSKLVQIFDVNPSNTDPVRVTVTGASGQIGYALVYRIASGQMFGNRPVSLQLLELPQALKALQGVVMELRDCAFPLVADVSATDNVEKAFEGTEWALLVGARPRSKGMERGDLILANAEIFSAQGKALNQFADKNCKTVVVGNPANTNSLIAQANAKSIPAKNFTALTRLDHNRGLAQLAEKTGTVVSDIERFIIWGNHSATQYPDISHTQIGGVWAKNLLDDKWIREFFIPSVQQRGAEIIAARGASSAASAASAVIDHVRDWIDGSDTWTSMAIPSSGEYGVTPGLIFSYPVVVKNGEYHVVEEIPVDEFSAQKMEISHQELLKERDTVAHLL
eukprot:TRINITY_DN570_c0_g1_i1.p1 TRINITY_DN570_c0_g1~~TRINITY_DN570_c0_g1_i1.p1  ORF type:complete len:446 (-),score=97.73 TRINITY_DN570_c0_g1_i1:145-1482(-)